MSSFNATAQTSLPGWVRARGMAVYLLTFQGGQALGSLAWGVVAEHASTRAAFTAAAAGLTLGLPAARRWVLEPEGLDLRPSGHWPEPHLVIEPDPAHGPILVTVEYRVAPERQDEFRALMRRQGRARRRTGAHRWGLYQDGADPERFVETYVVTSWNEHVRQHERVTRHDQQLEDQVRALAEGPPSVTHLFFAYER
jgi:quinol monooxygenase YgiN